MLFAEQERTQQSPHFGMFSVEPRKNGGFGFPNNYSVLLPANMSFIFRIRSEAISLTLGYGELANWDSLFSGHVLTFLSWICSESFSRFMIRLVFVK